MSKRKRKVKLKTKNIILIVTIILTLIALLTFGASYLLRNNNPISNNQVKPPVEIEKPKEYKTNLIMVGDALIHSSVYRDANRLANYKGYDFKPQIKLIKEKVTGYDIAYYNQETILGGTSIGLSDYPTFNSPQEVGDAMLDAGFNLVSLATNHTADRGKKAILLSREYWNKQENVQAVGSYSSAEEKQAIESKVLEKNGITYAMLNYTYGTNGMPVENEYLVNVWPTNNKAKYESYKEKVKKDILNIRNKVDVLIVAMHWGVEYTHIPTEYEEDMAKYLSDNGVDIIIGTHPHVIQPVKWINNTLVFYSLGNFISAQYQNQSTCTNYKCMVGLMSSLEITKTVYQGETTIKIDNIENELIYTYYTNWSRFEVIPFSSEEIKSHLKNYQNVYNTYAKIINSDDERITTVPLVS